MVHAQYFIRKKIQLTQNEVSYRRAGGWLNRVLSLTHAHVNIFLTYTNLQTEARYDTSDKMKELVGSNRKFKKMKIRRGYRALVLQHYLKLKSWGGFCWHHLYRWRFWVLSFLVFFWLANLISKGARKSRLPWILDESSMSPLSSKQF